LSSIKPPMEEDPHFPNAPVSQLREALQITLAYHPLYDHSVWYSIGDFHIHFLFRDEISTWKTTASCHSHLWFHPETSYVCAAKFVSHLHASRSVSSNQISQSIAKSFAMIISKSQVSWFYSSKT